MADLTTTINKRSVFGNLRVVFGSAACSGTTGEIVTGLRVLLWIALTAYKSTVVADAPSLAGATSPPVPLAGGKPTVIYTSGVTSIEFMAVGY